MAGEVGEDSRGALLTVGAIAGAADHLGDFVEPAQHRGVICILIGTELRELRYQCIDAPVHGLEAMGAPLIRRANRAHRRFSHRPLLHTAGQSIGET
jgi:hypothetical protein